MYFKFFIQHTNDGSHKKHTKYNMLSSLDTSENPWLFYKVLPEFITSSTIICVQHVSCILMILRERNLDIKLKPVHEFVRKVHAYM